MSIRLEELATLLEATLLGEGSYSVSRCGEIQSAAPGVLVAPARVEQAISCIAAGAAVMLGSDVMPPASDNRSVSGLICSKPRVQFNALSRLLMAQDDLMGQTNDVFVADGASVHPSAVVAPGCVIQGGASVGPHAVLFPGVVVERDAQVGAGSVVRSRAVIARASVLGPLCEIGSGSVIGAEPQQFEAAEGVWARQNDRTRVVLGSRVVIGANSVIECGARRETVIESDVLVGGQVYIAHDCYIEQGVLIIGQSGLASGVHVGAGAALMARVAVDVDIQIGAGALVLATSGVTKDVPPRTRVWGNPARSRTDALRRVRGQTNRPREE